MLLANCPDDTIRNPTLAVDLARKVNTQPDGLMWQYLALSQYRSGAREDAKFSIEQSMKIQNEGDPLDRILLTMAQFQLENETEARELFTKAVKDSESPIYYGHVGVIGFQLLRAEAENLLKRDRETVNGSNPKV